LARPFVVVGSCRDRSHAPGADTRAGCAALNNRAGSIAYNKALSLRRAKSVKKALIDEGLASDTIAITSRGESEPLVHTADGVRESQNRRVHISFRGSRECGPPPAW
jgi:hypothetical protein